MGTLNICLGCFLAFLIFSCHPENTRKGGDVVLRPKKELWPVNEEELPIGEGIKAIIGATLIDGNGGEPVENSAVVIRGNQIVAVGKKSEVEIPAGAEVTDAKGLTLIPGLMDAHFHLDRSAQLPHVFLKNGITSLRDPGAWIEAYDGERMAGYPLPRLFLTGPHFDMYPPAYPHDAYVVRDEEEARTQVNRLADQGATALKVYFRLPLGLIKAVCEEAHQRGMVVTGHLEIVNAMDAVNAGLDGIEHVTSLGTSLIPLREAEKYRQAMLLDNNARRSGRYEMWARIVMEGARLDSLIGHLARERVYLSATLAVYEYRDQMEDSIKYEGFKNMVAFIGKAKKGGVPVVVGSHSVVPFADLGWAYQRELELLAESGLTNQEIIVAATMENARYFKVEERLGSIEVNKQADMVLLAENPLEDIQHMRKIHKVMLNGTWIERE